LQVLRDEHESAEQGERGQHVRDERHAEGRDAEQTDVDQWLGGGELAVDEARARRQSYQ
jgi:hypothetical protein